MNDDDFSNILFEKKQDEIMSIEQMREVYLFYTKLKTKMKYILNIILNVVAHMVKEFFYRGIQCH